MVTVCQAHLQGRLCVPQWLLYTSVAGCEQPHFALSQLHASVGMCVRGGGLARCHLCPGRIIGPGRSWAQDMLQSPDPF